MAMKNYPDGTNSLESLKCVHIHKAVNLQELQDAVKRTGFLKDCVECQQLPDNDIYHFNSALWICLRCGHQACGQYQNKHALNHFNIHSSSHAICVNTSFWNVWCYICSSEIAVTCNVESCEYVRNVTHESRQQLQAVIEFLMGQSVTSSHTTPKNCKYCQKDVKDGQICTKCRVLHHGHGLESPGMSIISNLKEENKRLRQVIKDKEEIIDAKNCIIKFLNEKTETQ